MSDAQLEGARLHQMLLNEQTRIDEKWYQVWEIVNQIKVQRLLANIDLSGANLNLANLRSADLSNSDLSNVTLIEGDLRNANLHGTTFYQSNLTESSLRMADLTNADLRGANLTGVDLSGANLVGVVLDEETILLPQWKQTWELVNRVCPHRCIPQLVHSVGGTSAAHKFEERQFTRDRLNKSGSTRRRLDRCQS